MKLGVLLLQQFERLQAVLPFRTPDEHGGALSGIVRVQPNGASQLLDGGDVVRADLRLVYAVAGYQVDRLVEDAHVAQHLHLGQVVVAEVVDDGLSLLLGGEAVHGVRVDSDAVVAREHFRDHPLKLLGGARIRQIRDASSLPFLQHACGDEERLVAERGVQVTDLLRDRGLVDVR